MAIAPEFVGVCSYTDLLHDFYDDLFRGLLMFDRLAVLNLERSLGWGVPSGDKRIASLHALSRSGLLAEAAWISDSRVQGDPEAAKIMEEQDKMAQGLRKLDRWGLPSFVPPNSSEAWVKLRLKLFPSFRDL